MVEVLLIAFILSLDAVSVSIAGGMESKTRKVGPALGMAIVFGLFQAVMPVAGWLTGEGIKAYIQALDHWIAFLLLSGVGIKMVYESFQGGKKSTPLDIKTLFFLGIATSIDAFIIGITLSLVKIPLLLSAAIIGIVTFVLSFSAYLLGNKIGKFLGKNVGIIGGILLIIIGLKILLEHLFA